MEALDVPNADLPVLTFWQGQIVDNRNHFFRTARWKAKANNDIDHWSKFRAFDGELKRAVQADRCNDVDLSQKRHVFMRWKEIFFVSPGEDCGLTIAGFYYCCMDRITGSIAGFYFDPSNQPWQKLLLRAQPARTAMRLRTTSSTSARCAASCVCGRHRRATITARYGAALLPAARTPRAVHRAADEDPHTHIHTITTPFCIGSEAEAYLSPPPSRAVRACAQRRDAHASSFP
eukprot:IDg15954t1